MIKVPQLVTGLVLWALVAVLLVTTWHMPYMVEGTPGPRFMPVLLAVALSLVTVLYWIEAYMTRKDGKDSGWNTASLSRPAMFLCISIGLVLLWNPLGAVPSVLLAAITELRVLERWSWKGSITVAAIMAAFTWALFSRALGIPLPTGILGRIL